MEPEIIKQLRENPNDLDTLIFIICGIAGFITILSIWYIRKRNFRNNLLSALSVLYKKRKSTFSDLENMQYILSRDNSFTARIEIFPRTKENRASIQSILNLRERKLELVESNKATEAVEYELDEKSELEQLARKLHIGWNKQKSFYSM